MTLFRLGIVSSGLAAATVEFGDCMSSNSSPNNTLTFSNQNFATAAADRTMIMIWFTQNTNLVTTGDPMNFCRLDGVDMTKRLELPAGNNISNYMAWTLPLAAGTSGEVKVNRSTSNGFTRAFGVLFAAYGLQSEIIDNSGVFFAGNAPLTTSFTLPQGGIFCGMALNFENTTFTWAGATEGCDQAADIGDSARLSGALISETSQGSTDITTTTAAVAHSQFFTSWR